MLRSTATVRAEIWTAVLAMLLASTAMAQLEFTEVLMNTLDPDEADWEWVEIRNTGPEINLNGYVFYDESNHQQLTLPNISADMSPTTIIPAGGAAVLYNGTRLGFDGERFRSAWGVSSSVPLIAVQNAPGLNNSGDRIALWSSLNDYLSDVEDPEMDTNYAMVAEPMNTSALLDFKTGFTTPLGASIEWNGMGSNSDGAEWAESVAGANHAVTSIRTTTPGALVGVGNPGIVPGGVPPAGLLITEIMYDPAGPEAESEWIEVYNNTGATIDFGATPYVLHDLDTTALTAENVTSGSIPDGGTAILYSGALALADVELAWGAGKNYIPVSDFLQGTQGLANGGDEFGLWGSLAAYQTDEPADSFAHSVATVRYDDDPNGGWPNNNGSGSIYLSNLGADPTLGSSWLLSLDGDGISTVATLDLEDHAGGDVGSPGFFGSEPTVDGDFNNDGAYDCTDIDGLVAEIAAGSNNGAFDLTGDGSVDGADLSAWLVEGGTANIGAAFLQGDANLNGVVDVSDFNVWNGSKFQSIAAWCSGDFNADGVVDVSDFNIWNGRKFQSSTAAALPEPAAALLVGIAGAALVVMRRLRAEHA